MGLDMYLKARKCTYISQYEDDPEYKPAYVKDALDKIICAIEVPEAFDKFGSRIFECDAMYWRKANAIHHWFVENVQHGNDDCGSYYVSTESLTQLRDLVRQVLNGDRKKTPELLPTQSGFFFGSTDYDEKYWWDLEDTEKSLSKILAMPDLESWVFEYQSSW